MKGYQDQTPRKNDERWFYFNMAVHQHLDFNGGSGCFELVDYSPYFSDLIPSDYHLSPNMKKHLAGNQYRNDDAIISAFDDFFDQQDESIFNNRIQAL